MLCAPLSLGAQIVTLPRPALEPLLELVAAHRVTHLAVPPPLFDALARDPRVDEHDLSSVRLVITGGAHMHPDVEQALSERLRLRGAPGLRGDRDDVHDQRSARSPQHAGDRRLAHARHRGAARRPGDGRGRRARESRASCGCAALRSCRATTACPRTPPRHHARRLAAHRRPRRHPRRRPARDPRPPQGAHQGQGRLGRARRDRARAAPAPGGARRRRRRRRPTPSAARRRWRSWRSTRPRSRSSSRTSPPRAWPRYKRPREIVVVDEVPRVPTGQAAAPCPARARARAGLVRRRTAAGGRG